MVISVLFSTRRPTTGRAPLLNLYGHCCSRDSRPPCKRPDVVTLTKFAARRSKTTAEQLHSFLPPVIAVEGRTCSIVTLFYSRIDTQSPGWNVSSSGFLSNPS